MAGKVGMTAGMGMCTACGAGKTNDAAKTACVACVAGKFAAAGDALGCQNCAVGKYVAVENGATKATCDNCAAGKTKHAQGLLVLQRSALYVSHEPLSCLSRTRCS